MANNPRRAIYAGTFDPITNGHRDIIQKALTIFDGVVVAVAESTQKKVLFPTAERVDLVRAALVDFGNKVEVRAFDGLLVEFARREDINVIVRGLRAVSDYEYEAQVATVNRHLAPDIETIFFLSTNRSSFISSSIVKEVAMNRGDISDLVPENVARELDKKFPRK